MVLLERIELSTSPLPRGCSVVPLKLTKAHKSRHFNKVGVASATFLCQIIFLQPIVNGPPAPQVVMLTETRIRNAKCNSGRLEFPDGNGLSLRVSPNGRRVWTVSFRVARCRDCFQ
jgi:hypothetical protein